MMTKKGPSGMCVKGGGESGRNFSLLKSSSHEDKSEESLWQVCSEMDEKSLEG